MDEAVSIRGGESAPPVAECYLLNAEQFRFYWPQIEECLDADPLLWNTVYTKEAIVSGVLEQRLQMWAVCDIDSIHVVFMTHMVLNPAGRVLEVVWMFGRGAMDALYVIDAVLDSFAASQGCDTIKVTGRRGWDRVLRPLGVEYISSSWMRPVRKLKEN
jgi:hypothetical protein